MASERPGDPVEGFLSARDQRDTCAPPSEGARNGLAHPARCAGDDRPSTGERRLVCHRNGDEGPYAKRRNSLRVIASSRKLPRNAEVMVLEFCFSTPRIIMQR